MEWRRFCPNGMRVKQNKTKGAMNERRLEWNKIGKTFESHCTEKISPEQ
jgi:hypothetical protein